MEETGEGGGGVGGGGGEEGGVERGKRDSSFKDSPTRVRAYPTSLKETKLFIKWRKSMASVCVSGVKKGRMKIACLLCCACLRAGIKH